MTLLYVVDTNVLAELLRPEPHKYVLEQLRRFDGSVAVPSLVWHEMWFGCKRLPPSAKREAIETFLTQVVAGSLPILPYEEAAGEWHATERARLMALGRTPPFVDGMIAAIACTRNLTLVTRNLDDYRAFQGLRLENWHQTP